MRSCVPLFEQGEEAAEDASLLGRRGRICRAGVLQLNDPDHVLDNLLADERNIQPQLPNQTLDFLLGGRQAETQTKKTPFRGLFVLSLGLFCRGLLFRDWGLGCLRLCGFSLGWSGQSAEGQSQTVLLGLDGDDLEVP